MSFGSPSASNHATEKTDTTVGLLLNSLDGELGSGLELYLPTAITRLRLAKTRIDSEIKRLENKLEQQVLLSQWLPKYKTSGHQAVYTTRLNVLRHHQAVINQTMTNSLAGGQFVLRLSQLKYIYHQWIILLENVPRWLIHLCLRWHPQFQKKEKNEALLMQARTLEKMIDQEMRLPQPNAETLSQLVFAFDKVQRALRQAHI